MNYYVRKTVYRKDGYKEITRLGPYKTLAAAESAARKGVETADLLIKYEAYTDYDVCPCPICGHNVSIEKVNNGHRIMCKKCGIGTFWGGSVKELVRRWNEQSKYGKLSQK